MGGGGGGGGAGGRGEDIQAWNCGSGIQTLKTHKLTRAPEQSEITGTGTLDGYNLHNQIKFFIAIKRF